MSQVGAAANHQQCMWLWPTRLHTALSDARDSQPGLFRDVRLPRHSSEDGWLANECRQLSENGMCLIASFLGMCHHVTIAAASSVTTPARLRLPTSSQSDPRFKLTGPLQGQVKEDLYALDRFFVRPATAGQDKADAVPRRRVWQGVLGSLHEVPGLQGLRGGPGLVVRRCAPAQAFSIPAQVLERALIPGRPVHSVSFAQLMNGTGLRCDFFVSHSWSHPFTKTLVALNSCAKRCTGDTKKIAFWICLFALNQHDLKGELAGCELARMPFAYGLSKSKQGVVMVLDARVEPFRRIWCLYEATGTTTHNTLQHPFPADVSRECRRVPRESILSVWGSNLAEVQRAWELAKDLRLITDCAEGRGFPRLLFLQSTSLSLEAPPQRRSWKSPVSSRSL